MSKSKYVLPVAAALIALIFSINNDSIWIDEMITYQVVHEKNFSEMFINIWNDHSANGGMPLYFIFEWIFTQLFGYSEIGLRSLNILFSILYFITSWTIIRKMNVPSYFSLLFFLNPVFIYYMNEARPYVMLLSIGSIYTYLLFYRDLNDFKTLFRLHFVFILGLLTHMMFVFIILMYVVQSIRLIRLGKLHIRKHLIVIGVYSIPFIAILYHYIGIMTGASEIGGVSKLMPNWKASIIQIVYYFTGFGGLGLSRNDLRSLIFSQLSWVHIIFTTLLVFSYVIVIFYIIKNKLWKEKHLHTYLYPAFVTFSGFCVINILFQTRFWERHIIYLLPVLLIFLCCILKLMISSKKIVYKMGAILMICLVTISGLRIMFDNYYKKDDYKGVASYINNSKEGIFLLQGTASIYNYYGIDLNSNRYVMINNLNSEDLIQISSEKETPLFLVLSSREEFDSGRLYYKQYETNNIKYNSFRIVQYIPWKS